MVGTIKDKVGVKVATGFQILLLIAGTGLILAQNNLNEFGTIAYLMVFVWGLQDSGTNCLMRSMLGFEFEDKTTPFAVMGFVQSIAVFAFNLIEA